MDRKAGRIAAFRDSAMDRVSLLGVTWIQIESGVASSTATTEILRELHALKGEAAVLGFTSATGLIHAIEAAVGRGADAPSEAILRGFDLLADLLRADPATPAPPELVPLLGELGTHAPAPARMEHSGEHAIPQRLEHSGEHAIPQRLEHSGEHAIPGQVPARRELGLRIATNQLDRMRDAIGDLFALRIRLVQIAEQLEAGRRNVTNLHADVKRSESQLRDDALALGNALDALEETVRDLRLVPIGSLLERYPRMARDLGKELGKNVRVTLSGESAGVDRNVVEALDTALLHLVRNAVDHGIESPDKRRASGKPEAGSIAIAASVAGSRFHVSVADDGGGIDSAAVRKSAVARGLVEAGVEASEQQVLQWILLPGFTTRATATHVSGRGVGLDAVHASVQALGGSLEVSSRPGRGTTFLLSVPINTAITAVLLFKVGSSHFALPSGSIEDIVDAHDYRLDSSLSGPKLSYRGEDIPVIAFGSVVNHGATPTDQQRVVIVRTGLGFIACTGSRDHELRDVVLRPAGSLLTSQGIATAAIVLEGGEVALVLNPARLRNAIGRTDTATPKAITVLIVDDSPIIRDIVAEVLRSHGLIVIEAADGVEALEHLERRPEIELIVTDVEMPRMGGLELIGQVRAKHTRRLPAVVVSTRGSDEDKQKAVAVGADAYLVKSDLSHESLWSLIGRFVDAA